MNAKDYKSSKSAGQKIHLLWKRLDNGPRFKPKTIFRSTIENPISSKKGAEDTSYDSHARHKWFCGIPTPFTITLLFFIATIDDFPMECDDCNPIINPTTHNLTLKSSLEAFNYNVSRMTLIWMKTCQIGFVIIIIYSSLYIM